MDETGSSRSDRDVKALRHGLKILELVARSDRPLSATTIGVEIGLHQTSVSRILNTLSAEGYVRKARPRGYIASLGVFSLSSAAIQQFPLTKKADSVLRAAIEEFPDLSAALATIWRGELMNFGCSGAGQSIALLSAPRSPLHLSAAGLRLLIDFHDRKQSICSPNLAHVSDGPSHPASPRLHRRQFSNLLKPRVNSRCHAVSVA